MNIFLRFPAKAFHIWLFSFSSSHLLNFCSQSHLFLAWSFVFDWVFNSSMPDVYFQPQHKIWMKKDLLKILSHYFNNREQLSLNNRSLFYNWRLLIIFILVSHCIFRWQSVEIRLFFFLKQKPRPFPHGFITLFPASL